MKPYRLHLTLRGRLGTALSGDTLMGHVCWGIVYHEGEAALGEFLAAMKSPQPPLMIGDPCPAGSLPAPVLPPAPTGTTQRLAEFDLLKSFRKRRWIPLSAMTAAINDLSLESLAATGQWTPAPALIESAVMQNTINRLTQHTAEEGGLFSQADHFADGDYPLDLYILSTLPPERIIQLVTWALEGGYGRDASSGRGHLLVGSLDDAPWPTARNPNAAMALGVFAPSCADPANGFWKSLTRRGKLGGAYAVEDGPHKPFKYPLIVLSAGSVLAPCSRPWLGRVVEGVHPTRPEVVTIAMTPVLQVHCPALNQKGVA